MDTANQVPKGGIAIYSAAPGDVRLVVRLEGDTLWLTQRQMADLFGIDQGVVARHLRSVFSSGELDEGSSMQKMHRTPGQTGRTAVRYNLDAVISVGYRSNSVRATQFRIWATKTLRRYVTDGYALNRDRLAEVHADKLRELQDVVGTVARLATRRQLAGHEGELIELIDQYAHSWKILEEYDAGTVETRRGSPAEFMLTHDTATRLVKALRERMGDASPLFGQEVHGKFRASLGALDQTFEGGELYPSAEEKAAHLLYFVVKDHPFLDGNKRVGSFLFIYYLQKNGIWLKESGERRISDNALAALALMVAESRPEEKGTMVRLIVSLLQNG